MVSRMKARSSAAEPHGAEIKVRKPSAASAAVKGWAFMLPPRGIIFLSFLVIVLLPLLLLLAIPWRSPGDSDAIPPGPLAFDGDNLASSRERGFSAESRAQVSLMARSIET